MRSMLRLAIKLMVAALLVGLCMPAYSYGAGTASPGSKGWKAAASGALYNVGIKADGTVWAWGTSWDPTGNPPEPSFLVPKQVPGLQHAVAAASGDTHSFVLLEDGTVWGWGDNSLGTIGDGTTTSRVTPVQVSGLSDVVSIDADAM